MLEGTSWIHIIAWIDTDLLAVLSSYIGYMSSEMDISNQRSHISVSFQLSRNLFHVLCLTSALRRKSNKFTTSIDNSLGLSHTTLSIIGVDRSHRLHSNGIITTNSYGSHLGYR